MKENNLPRVGDEIIKQQVAYKDPGRAGENVLWDFSTLDALQEEYTLTYNAPFLLFDSLYVMGQDTLFLGDAEEEELILGNEHFTRYLYRVREDRLELLGYHNPVSSLTYTPGLPVIPFSGKQAAGKYISETSSPGSGKLYVNGYIEVEADASGMMVLPDKDTIRNVVRVRSFQQIRESGDSLEKRLFTIPDEVQNRYRIPLLQTEIETFRWYVRGYRYPVFETIKTINYTDTLPQVYYTTAFFYPPQEHYYLWNDPENLALWNEGKEEEGPGLIIDPREKFSYNFYPNPVKDILTVEYYTAEALSLKIMLHDLQGKLLYQQTNMHAHAGIYMEKIDMNNYEKGNYLLSFITEGQPVVNENIIKE